MGTTETCCLHKQIADDDGIFVETHRWRGESRRKRASQCFCVCEKERKDCICACICPNLCA